MPRRDEPHPFVLKPGTTVRDLRRKKNMSLDELALASGVSKGHLSGIEHGRVLMNVGTAETIARALGLKLMTLCLFPSESPLDAIVDELRTMTPSELVKMLRRLQQRRRRRGTATARRGA
jgi:transcriptional regulator with XRE-family HTH domain